MDQEREPRLRRLEDAIEAYLAKDETVPVDAFLARETRFLEIRTRFYGEGRLAPIESLAASLE